jgi:hypothetical protein
LFWTIPISEDSVEIDLESGTAEYALNLLQTLDFHDLANDLEHGASQPATISFHVRWSGKKRTFTLADAATRFRGEFIDTSATMEWSAAEAHRSFVSDEAETSSSVSAVLGREQNGVFFNHDDHDDEHE